MLVTDDANPFFTDVARGARQLTDRDGLILALFSSDHSVEREERYLSVIEEQRVLGLLFDGTRDDLVGIVNRGTPVVLLDRNTADPRQSSVSVDDVRGGQLAALHLLSQGVRDVVIIGGPLILNQVRDRFDGFSSEYQRAVGTLPRIVQTDALTTRAGLDAGLAVLGDESRRPRAVFCANDLIALGVLTAAFTLGVKVPQDVALVGYDDIDLAASAHIPLTSVRQPRQKLGSAAMSLLLDQVKGGSTYEHQHIKFEPAMAVRASSIV